MNLTENKTPAYSTFILLIDELLIEGKILELTVGGYSMFPFLRNGDTVLLQKVPFDTLISGDIVVFHSVNKLVAHRIIALKKTKTGKKIITKGDALLSFDKPINKEGYIGKITSLKIKNQTFSLETHKRRLINKMIVIYSIFSIPIFIILFPITLFFQFFKAQLIPEQKEISNK